MLIRPVDLARIRDGEIDLAFRRWARPRLLIGTRMRTSVGLVEVISVDEVDDITDEDAALIARLDRFDRASSRGPWTRETLAIIGANPARRAADLAAALGRETAPFKRDVRKLKELGLTESLEIGYRLSPRGVALLESL